MAKIYPLPILNKNINRENETEESLGEIIEKFNSSLEQILERLEKREAELGIT